MAVGAMQVQRKRILSEVHVEGETEFCGARGGGGKGQEA